MITNDTPSTEELVSELQSLAPDEQYTLLVELLDHVLTARLKLKSLLGEDNHG